MIPDFIFTGDVKINLVDDTRFKADEVELYDRHIMCIRHDQVKHKCLNRIHVKSIIAKERR